MAKKNPLIFFKTLAKAIFLAFAASLFSFSSDVFASNSSYFAGQSVPATMSAGQTYQVSVTFINNGSTIWNKAADYKLGSENLRDNMAWGINRVEMSDGESIATYQTKTFTFNVTAPSTPKTYIFQWRMVQGSDQWFGNYTNTTQVNVITGTTDYPPACANDCASGARQCSGNGYQICGNYDGDDCAEWSNVIPCGSNLICSSGQCANNTSGCNPRASKKCDGGDLYWYDSCGNRQGIFQDCGEKCVNGVCASGDTAMPIISGATPSGTVYSSGVILSVNTNEIADCRADLNDKTFDQMSIILNSSLDKLRHSTLIFLKNFGNQLYYVRCRDAAGNKNLASGKIAFIRAASSSGESPDPKVTPSSGEPRISRLSPSGEVNSGSITISCATNETADCKYDIYDTTYTSMRYSLESQNGMLHRKKVNLGSPGAYVYYVRCKNNNGSINPVSARISFRYLLPQSGEPAISNLRPTGTVYQKNVAITFTTDKISECRWSFEDKDFDLMAEPFSTADGITQMTAIDLGDYGKYGYYVRCQNADGGKNTVSTLVTFNYADPTTQNQSENLVKPTECRQTTIGSANYICDPAVDCVCDPDCAAYPEPGCDPDCGDLNNKGWLFDKQKTLSAAAAAGIIIFISAISAIIKKIRGKTSNKGGSFD